MINTRSKRSSALGLTPWTAILPPSDGVTDRPDRRQLCFLYRGDAELTGSHAHCVLDWTQINTCELEQV